MQQNHGGPQIALGRQMPHIHIGQSSQRRSLISDFRNSRAKECNLLMHSTGAVVYDLQVIYVVLTNLFQHLRIGT